MHFYSESKNKLDEFPNTITFKAEIESIVLDIFF